MLWVSTMAFLIPPLPATEDTGEGAKVGARLSSLLSFPTSFPHPLPSPASPSGKLHLPGPADGLHPSKLRGLHLVSGDPPGQNGRLGHTSPNSNLLPKSQRLGTP